MIIQKGNYLTLKQFGEHLGGISSREILRAISEDRLIGSIRLDENVLIIPKDAVLITKESKKRKAQGCSEWIRGEKIDKPEPKQKVPDNALDRRQMCRSLKISERKIEELEKKGLPYTCKITRHYYSAVDVWKWYLSYRNSQEEKI